MSALSLRHTCWARRIGHPYVAVGVHIDAVRPNEHAAAEALDRLAGLQTEFHHHVQIRVKTLIAEPLWTGVAANDRPNVLAVGVDDDATNSARLATLGQLRPIVHHTVGIRVGLRKQLNAGTNQREECQR